LALWQAHPRFDLCCSLGDAVLFGNREPAKAASVPATADLSLLLEVLEQLADLRGRSARRVGELNGAEAARRSQRRDEFAGGDHDSGHHGRLLARVGGRTPPARGNCDRLTPVDQGLATEVELPDLRFGS